jgi:Mycothiol-dependent nitroreductase Rv2466c
MDAAVPPGIQEGNAMRGESSVTNSPVQAEPTARRVSVYVDPACPWTWITSQWLREVAPHRNLDLRWRSLSLWLRDGEQPQAGVPAEIRALAVAARTQSHRLLRVFEALRAASREDDVDHLYRLWGERAFTPSWPPVPPGPNLIGEIVTAAGLPAEWAASADDPAWDTIITASMTAAAAACGPGPASPTIVLDDETPVGFAGPVFSPAPLGPAALRAWDAVSALLTEPGFIELSRPRTSPIPALTPGERPAIPEAG